jgi:adenine deaminase
MDQSVRELSNLIDAALGKRPLDLVVRGATVVNVFTGEQYAADIGVWQGKIVAVGTVPAEAANAAKATLDWSGRYALPGFFDPHFHIGGSQLCVPELARALLRHGTTSIASDLQELYSYAGPRGARHVLDEAARSGLRILFLPAVHLLGIERQGRFRHAVSGREMERMLEWPEAIGINEPPPAQVLGKNRSVLRLIAATRARGQTFAGHLPALRGASMQAYAAAGGSSDHESMNDVEGLEKLRVGIWPMMRQGSAASDMARMLPMLHSAPMAGRFSMVCSDEQDPADLFYRGNIDEKLRLAVSQGTDPVTAVQMGTLNPALYYGFANRFGSITPGKAADLVAVRDLKGFEVTDVVSGGKPVVRAGELLMQARRTRYPPYLRSQVRWPRPPAAADFAVAATGKKARVRVIGVADGSLLSQRLEATLPVLNGNVQMDPGQDVLKMAVMDRHSGRMRIGTGFIGGLGLKDGAVATTYCHVHYNVLVIGTSEEQMALAASKLAKLGGGVVVVRDQRAIVEWRLDLVGVFSTEPVEETCLELQKANQALRDMGCTFSSPILGLSFVALTTIPGYGMTELGLYDVEKEKFVDTVIR